MLQVRGLDAAPLDAHRRANPPPDSLDLVVQPHATAATTATAAVQLFLRLDMKLGTADLRAMLETVDAGDTHVLLVVDDITVTAKKEFMRLPRAELFRREELVLDIMNHDIYAKHVIPRMLSAQEVDAVCAKYKVTTDDFPNFLESDPLVRYFGGRPGDVFELTRCWVRSAPRHRTYRVVVATSV